MSFIQKLKLFIKNFNNNDCLFDSFNFKKEYTKNVIQEYMIQQEFKSPKFVLFLDFDGVLHRGNTGTFRKAPLLDKILQEIPELVIVLSTSWRNGESTENLKQYFTNEKTVSSIHSSLPILPYVVRGIRQREIETWLMTYPDVKKYLALDDSTDLFDENCSFLYTTNPIEALTEEDVSNIINYFKIS